MTVVLVRMYPRKLKQNNDYIYPEKYTLYAVHQIYKWSFRKCNILPYKDIQSQEQYWDHFFEKDLFKEKRMLMYLKTESGNLSSSGFM